MKTSIRAARHAEASNTIQVQCEKLQDVLDISDRHLEKLRRNHRNPQIRFLFKMEGVADLLMVVGGAARRLADENALLREELKGTEEDLAEALEE